MPPTQDSISLLADLRRRRRNRRVEEVERVLVACGFERRLATKEGTVWNPAMTRTRDLDRYLRLDYPYELDRDGRTGTFFSRHPDLPGCAAQGASANEAVRNLDTARRLWIRTRLEDGLHVPEPPEDEPSGRVSLRMPTSLHAELNRMATRKGVSLNLILNTILAEYVGRFDYREELREIRDAIRDAVRELQRVE